ncbi:MAG TPA: lytic transglycosylase domain-containing protein [Solirubrobacteraceae bacterium]|nr:lytic transglycosylase domain-containing protein [Solirubrobacteraceae bacterium]
MSTQALSGVPAGELLLMQRVQQLQSLIESARQVALGGSVGATRAAPTGSLTRSSAETAGAQAYAGQAYTVSPYGPDFATALQAATGADAAGVDDPSGVAGYAGAGDYAGATGATDVAYSPALGSAAGEGEGGSYEALIDQAAARYGLDPAVLHGLIQQESGFDPNATSSAGAAGLTQLMPGTAASLGVANPLNPAESIEGGARYLSEMMNTFGGNTADALAAYNAGPGAVQEYGGVPPYEETESYVSKVLGYAESYRQSHPQTTGALL